LKLEELQHARIGSLSKGERKRTLLALACSRRSRCCCWMNHSTDWICGNARCDGAVACADGRGRTLMLSIHQLNDAARVCDRLVLLSGGRVVGEGSLDELRAQAQLSEAGLEEVFLALT
jgi:ABC-2 type transport system ATP-binding protein